MAESLPILSTTSTGDIERDKKGTLKNREKGLSLSQCIVGVLRSEPDYAFVIRDVCDRTNGCYASVKRILARLSSDEKGSGPVRQVRHGMYQYDSSKEQESLQALIRSGNWKVENLTFVSLGAQGGAVSRSEIVPKQVKGTRPDPSQPTPHPDVPYPWKIPTGQLVTWNDYENGTQIIRISANGAPPISPDAALLLINIVKKLGMDDSWNCISLELNLDSRYHRIDGSYSLQLIEGVLLKAYQHGYVGRIEIADRQTHTMREVTAFLRSMINTFDGQGIIRQVKGMDERLTRCERIASHALTQAVKVREEPGRGPALSRKKEHNPTFKRGSEIKKDPASATEPERLK